jgi:REP element-mobilizing transposase RayT
MEPGSLGAIIRGFKSSATNHINHLRDSPATSVWQRNYYEHAIRNEEELQKIRTYIRENPKHWPEDEEYSPPKK